jgi:hypothetical protein
VLALARDNGIACHEVERLMPDELRADHSAYDLFGVGDRLPRKLPFGLGGPVNMGQLAMWSVAAAMSLVAMFVSRRRRPHGMVISIAAFVTAADVYVSWLGDSLEVQRHLMGAIARLGVVLAMAVTIGVDELVRPVPGRDPTEDDAPEEAEAGTPDGNDDTAHGAAMASAATASQVADEAVE